jgi:uncharacterized phage infection (PIP) family protein YhgE
MSKRNPSRRERFAEIQSALGDALSTVQDLLEKVRTELGATHIEAETIVVFTPEELAAAERAAGIVDDAKQNAEELSEELQNWLDNLPENLQSGSKAEELEEAISNLEEFTSGLEDADLNDLTTTSADELEEFLEAAESAIDDASNVCVDFPGMF